MEPFHTIVDLITGNLSFNQLIERLQAMNPLLAFLCCVIVCSGMGALIFASVSLSMAGFVVEGNVADWAQDGAMIGAGVGVFGFIVLNFLEA